MSDSPTEAFVEIDNRGKRSRHRLGTLCRVGRNEDNDIVLQDNLISRNHALLYSADSQDYYINDLASSNGVTVNQTRVTAPTLLHNGDKIWIGNCELTFRQTALRGPKRIEALGATNVQISQKLITVMVVDIRGYTGLARRVTNHKLSELTGALVRESGFELQRQGAASQKYIGDAVMAIWDHPLGTIRATELVKILTALSRISDIGRGLQPRFELDRAIRLGAGVNSGLASVGNLGSVAASDYTALGDTVNLAFRLESATKESGFDVLLGQETRQFAAQETPDVAKIFRRRILTLKGYDAPVTAYGTSFEALKSAVDPGTQPAASA